MYFGHESDRYYLVILRQPRAPADSLAPLAVAAETGHLHVMQHLIQARADLKLGILFFMLMFFFSSSFFLFFLFFLLLLSLLFSSSSSSFFLFIPGTGVRNENMASWISYAYFPSWHT